MVALHSLNGALQIAKAFKRVFEKALCFTTQLQHPLPVPSLSLWKFIPVLLARCISQDLNYLMALLHSATIAVGTLVSRPAS